MDRALVQAQQLEAIKTYLWNRSGFPPATIFIEQRGHCRIFFKQYNWDGSIMSQSGWHGRAEMPQTFMGEDLPLGVSVIELHGFRYSGAASKHHHHMVMCKTSNTTSYSCRFCHTCGHNSYTHNAQMMEYMEPVTHPPLSARVFYTTPDGFLHNEF